MPFRAILQTLVDTYAPLIDGAVFCDGDGEKVDAAVTDAMAAEDLDLFGASYAAIARDLRESSCLKVCHDGRTVWLATVESGYYLLAVCRPSPSGILRHALPRAVAALAAHM